MWVYVTVSRYVMSHCVKVCHDLGQRRKLLATVFASASGYGKQSKCVNLLNAENLHYEK